MLKMWQICRTCMANRENMISIFNQDKSPSIYAMIKAITSLELLPNDALPPQICVTCLETLEVTYYFKEQVIRCNDALQQQANSKFSEANDLPEENSTHLKQLRFHFEDISVKSEQVEVEEHGVQFRCNAETIRPQIPLKNEDDYEDKREEEIKLYEESLPDINECDFDESCIKHEIEEHGVHFGHNGETLPPKNEADDEDKGEKGAKLYEENMPDISNCDFDESCIKHEIEEHGVHFGHNGETIPPKNEADDEDKGEEDEKLYEESLPDINNCDFDESCIKHEVEGHGVHFVHNGRMTPSQALPTNAEDESQEIQPKSNKPTHICKDCGKIFSWASQLKKHMLVHTREKFICHICDAVFQHQGTLERHLCTHTGEAKPKPYKCDVCEKTFEMPSLLKRHKRLHTGEMIKCHICNETFKWESALYRHIRRHNGAPKTYKCEVCVKTFSFRENLMYHMRSHSDERPFKCQQCDAAFKWKASLDQHVLRLHTSEDKLREVMPKLFTCEVCGKAFTFNHSLNIHMRMHTGERPYKCQQCSAMFKHVCHLNRHIRKHTGEAKPKPCKCEVCGKAFEMPSQLTRHMRGHTGERPFKCHLCNAGFLSTGDRNRHIRTHSDKVNA